MNAAQDQSELRRLFRSNHYWHSISVVDEVGSTNAELAAAAATGVDRGATLIAGYQSAGRGRLNRTWTAPPDTAVAISVLARPQTRTAPGWPWLPLAAGLAVRDTLVKVAGVPAEVKWPNDVLVNGKKVVGILAELVETPTGPACVIGCGINLSIPADQLPTPNATSLALEGATVIERVPIIEGLLHRLQHRFGQWESARGRQALRQSYREACASLGGTVRVMVGDDASGQTFTGQGQDVDLEGRLVVLIDGEPRAFAAGDVTHLR